MCTTCGCGSDTTTITRLDAATLQPLPANRPRPPAVLTPHHAHVAAPLPTHPSLEIALLQHNDRLAAANRQQFAAARVQALNLVSSPGAGKTTLLEKTLLALRGQRPLAVIEGDQATDQDARRIAATGVAVVQVNTGTGCHLDAAMIQQALRQWPPLQQHLLLIENVGNLVCPALFDLGEQAKVVLLSVTEGDDKPLKYPHMFQAARLLLITKTDLLPHVDFDLDACIERARQINPRLDVIPLSARSGDGLSVWLDWIAAHAS